MRRTRNRTSVVKKMNATEVLPSYSCAGGESLRPSESTGTILKSSPGGGGLLSWRLSKMALISSFSSFRTAVAMMILAIVAAVARKYRECDRISVIRIM